MIHKDIVELFRVPPGKKIRLRDYNPGWAQTKEMKELGKDDIKERARIILDKNLEDLAEAQERLWADNRYAVLVVLQALDAAGKDGTIKHVMSGANPQGCQVFWKFSAADLAERGFWDQYTAAFEDAFSDTSTEWAPWYIVPADHKWATRAIVADILTTAILGLDLRFPEVTEAQHQALDQARQQLERE